MVDRIEISVSRKWRLKKGRAVLPLWGRMAEPPRVEGLSNTYGVLSIKLIADLTAVKIKITTLW